MTKKPRVLRKKFGVKKKKYTPVKKRNVAAKKPGKLGLRARLTKCLRKIK